MITCYRRGGGAGQAWNTPLQSAGEGDSYFAVLQQGNGDLGRSRLVEAVFGTLLVGI